MARCLRCGAGSEWLAGRALDDVSGELDSLEDVTNDRDEWKTQHENLLAMYRTASDRLAALESQHRWRSVAEENPPKDCLCLVAVPRHEHPLVDYWNGFIWLDWLPTHWMPLPALPPSAPEPTT